MRRALVPWATMALSLILALSLLGREALDRLAALDHWVFVLVGAGVAGGLGCSGLLVGSREKAARGMAIAWLPAALPWLTGLATLRAHMAAVDWEGVDGWDMGRLAWAELADGATGTALGLLLSAALFAGVTAGALGSGSTRAHAAALSSAALAWVAGGLALWHALVGAALDRAATMDAALIIEELTSTAATLEPIHRSTAVGGGVLAGLALLLVLLRSTDRRALALPVAAGALAAALAAGTTLTRDTAMSRVHALLWRPWNAEGFVAPSAADERGHARSAPLGVVGRDGVQVLERRADETKAEALRRLIDTHEAQAADRRRRLGEELPEWLDEATPEEALAEQPTERAPTRPASPDEDLARLQELARRAQPLRQLLARLCGEADFPIVRFAIDARAGAAALREAIALVRDAGLEHVELVGPLPPAPAAVGAIPLAAPVLNARSWSVSAHVRRECEPEGDTTFLTGVIGEHPLEALARLEEAIPLRSDAMTTDLSEPVPVVLALGDDATAEALVQTLARIDQGFGLAREVLLFPTADAAPRPPRPPTETELEGQTLRFSGVETRGLPNDELVLAALARHEEALRACFRHPAPAQPPTVELIIRPDGGVQRLWVATPSPQVFSDCIAEALATFGLAPIEEGIGVARFQLLLEGS